jgi:antitoxin HigA-1
MDIRFARPIHPGEMLREEFLVPLGISAGQLAKSIGVPRTRIERLIREETALTLDTALRLARYFRSTPDFWINMQHQYELDCLHADAPSVPGIEAIVPLDRPDIAAE